MAIGGALAVLHDEVVRRGRLISDTEALADEDLPRLFERFYRGRTATRTSGSGIGLAVASELVAAHGGTIVAANRPEGGAIFTVRLPARR